MYYTMCAFSQAQYTNSIYTIYRFIKFNIHNVYIYYMRLEKFSMHVQYIHIQCIHFVKSSIVLYYSKVKILQRMQRIHFIQSNLKTSSFCKTHFQVV